MQKLDKILVVDDNEITGYITEHVLQEMGIGRQVRLVKDGNEALEALKNGFKPSLILLDLNMPGMSGFAFLEKYQSLPQTAASAPNIIIFTTSTQPHVREKALSYQSVIGIVTKPITAQKLRQLLEPA